MGGKIQTTDRSVPPKLERILLAINSHGKLQNKGLATCSLGKLNSVTSAEAKKVCGDALVGHGNVTSRVSLPGQGPFASNAGLLAFNGKLNGKPAVLAQVSSGPRCPLTYVIAFEVKKARGDLRHPTGRRPAPDRLRIRLHLRLQPLAIERNTIPRQEAHLRLGHLPGPQGLPGSSLPLRQGEL